MSSSYGDGKPVRQKKRVWSVYWGVKGDWARVWKEGGGKRGKKGQMPDGEKWRGGARNGRGLKKTGRGRGKRKEKGEARGGGTRGFRDGGKKGGKGKGGRGT